MPLGRPLLDAHLHGHSGEENSQILESEIKTLAFVENCHRPGGVRTSDLQRQVCLPFLITFHSALKPRRREVSPSTAA